jgi:enterochelin esterase family protein
LAATKKGNIYCSVPGEFAVYLVNKDGKRKMGDNVLQAPSGLVLWPDQGSLVVADHAGTALWAFRIKKDGTLVAPEPYYPLRVGKSQPSEAEGITVDAGGLVYATSAEGVQVFDPTGRLCGVLLRPVPGAEVAVAFAGPERDHLVLACDNKLYVRKLLMKGLK